MRAHVIGPDYSVSSVFHEYGFNMVLSPKDADVIVWTGGEDINPALYNARPHPTSYWSERDNKEVEIYKAFENSGRVFAGICRGAQLFSAMNGGTLYQNVDKHRSGIHECTYVTEDGSLEEGHQVTSVHHQMINPYGSPNKFEVWGHTRKATYRDSELVERAPITNEDHPDIELIFWPETRCFGFQGHPEYRHKPSSDLFFRALTRAIHYKD